MNVHEDEVSSQKLKAPTDLLVNPERSNLPKTSELNKKLILTPDQIDGFWEKGFIRLQVFNPELTHVLESEISRVMHKHELAESGKPRPDNAYTRAFQQNTQIWRESGIAEAFVFSPLLAGTASQLLGGRAVRLWHDHALYKRPGDDVTAWHNDKFFWAHRGELSKHALTAWIALDDVTLDQGPLRFREGSNLIRLKKDQEISVEGHKYYDEHMSLKDLPLNTEPYKPGVVSFHLSRTYHMAGRNESDRTRRGYAVIFIADGIELDLPENANQAGMVENLRRYGVAPGDRIKSPENPIAYPLPEPRLPLFTR